MYLWVDYENLLCDYIPQKIYVYTLHISYVFIHVYVQVAALKNCARLHKVKYLLTCLPLDENDTHAHLIPILPLSSKVTNGCLSTQ